MEHYGDTHLHHTSYPDFPGQYEYEGTCRFDSGKQEQWDKYDKAPTPPGMDQCHVEVCHPGSWQGKRVPKRGCYLSSSASAQTAAG